MTNKTMQYVRNGALAGVVLFGAAGLTGCNTTNNYPSAVSAVEIASPGHTISIPKKELSDALRVDKASNPEEIIHAAQQAMRDGYPVVAENALEKVKIKLHEDTQSDQIILIVVLGGLAASACTYAASISRRD